MRDRRKPPRSLLLLCLLALTAVYCNAQAPVRLLRQVEWRDTGVWLRADLHAHSRFSDGAHPVNEVVAEAARQGCDVVAITDHADEGLTAATPEYLQAIEDARAETPSTVVVTGLEWNVPPGKGAEHAAVLFPTAMERVDLLGTFKERFDDWAKEGENPSLATEALAWLATADPDAVPPVVLVNHPSRRDGSTSAPRLTLPGLARSAPSILVGFEGAPGHQNADPLGAYDDEPKPVDRWDPIAADVGGTWDQWLGQGVDLWGAVANSDFHSTNGDFWPCEFATTWIYAPSRSVEGVLRALRGGTFFAEHGQIVTSVQLRAAIQGAERPIVIGEIAEAAVGTAVAVSLEMVPSPRDYLGRESRIDLVELVGITQDGARVLFSAPPSPEGAAFDVEMAIPEGGIVLRARGRRSLEDRTGLMFYTNPIRLVTP